MKWPNWWKFLDGRWRIQHDEWREVHTFGAPICIVVKARAKVLWIISSTLVPYIDIIESIPSRVESIEQLDVLLGYEVKNSHTLKQEL